MVHYSEQHVRAQVKLHDAEWRDRELVVWRQLSLMMPNSLSEHVVW